MDGPGIDRPARLIGHFTRGHSTRGVVSFLRDPRSPHTSVMWCLTNRTNRLAAVPGARLQVPDSAQLPSAAQDPGRAPPGIPVFPDVRAAATLDAAVRAKA